MATIARAPEPARASWLYDPKVRGVVYQAGLAAIVIFVIYSAATNAIENLRAAKIASGFGFLNSTSGFDVNQTLVPYNATSTYGRAFVVGLLNTLLVSVIGIVLATFLGFAVGVARLSPNWLVRKVATVYVELVRNIPLLIQLLFWYIAVLRPLPDPRNSLSVSGIAWRMPNLLTFVAALAVLGGSVVVWKKGRDLAKTPFGLQAVRAGAVVLGLGALAAMFFGSGLIAPSDSGLFFLNNRGLYAPKPLFDGAGWFVLGALALAIVAAVAFSSWARRTQAKTGRQYPVGLIAAALIIGLPAITWIVIGLVAGNPIKFELPEQTRFNLRGGLQIFPEFVALTLGLVIYTAAFIGEIVRAGILAVSKGQSEAANALGLRAGPTLNLVVIPQAMRVIIPPLTSQYLNLAKNSSLAVAIGYPDLVQVFMGTVLNQTGQAIECVAITMAVYLTISLVTSAIMNEYNRRKALVER